MSIFSDRLKKLRSIKKLKQNDFMDVTGTSRATISNYEQGKVIPPVEFLMKLAIAYNVSLDWLCGISGMPHGNLPEVRTVYDCIKMLICSCADVVDVCAITSENEEDFFNPTTTRIELVYEDKTDILADAVKEYIKTYNLYHDGVLDDNIVRAWLQVIRDRYGNAMIH